VYLQDRNVVGVKCYPGTFFGIDLQRAVVELQVIKNGRQYELVLGVLVRPVVFTVGYHDVGDRSVTVRFVGHIRHAVAVDLDLHINYRLLVRIKGHYCEVVQGFELDSCIQEKPVVVQGVVQRYNLKLAEHLQVQVVGIVDQVGIEGCWYRINKRKTVLETVIYPVPYDLRPGALDEVDASAAAEIDLVVIDRYPGTARYRDTVAEMIVDPVVADIDIRTAQNVDGSGKNKVSD